jgi:hypothetical protein
MVRLSSALVVLVLISSEWSEAKTFNNNNGQASPHPLTNPTILVAKGGATSTSTTGATDHIILGEDEKATESLEVSIPLSQSPALQKGRDTPLMRDISMLTDILLDLVRRDDPKVHDLYNEFLGLGKQR